ncbi:hypothetical protein RJT34_27127 [Clitoria ternatea]|uniref:Uncharacterized protein n=1 Tax=Clitoria ternatea TaxID=43366 RepID=A0AAN9IAU6_CLITE
MLSGTDFYILLYYYFFDESMLAWLNFCCTQNCFDTSSKLSHSYLKLKTIINQGDILKLDRSLQKAPSLENP